MLQVRRRFFRTIDVLREFVLVVGLAFPPRYRRRRQAPFPVVVSLTSYPARIRFSWRSVETLLRQTMKPHAVVLVLAEEEFSGRKLPISLRVRQKRGLSILWVERNGKSFDKLLPMLDTFPNTAIITCDDDKYFPKDLIASLVEESMANPEKIVGARGWAMRLGPSGRNISYGTNWVRATRGESGHHLFMPGGNGNLYPPGSFSEGVTDLSLALKICPTADDIWFWAHAAKVKTAMVCLGMPPHRPVRLFYKSSALSDVNKLANERQFRAVVKKLKLEWIVREAVVRSSEKVEGTIQMKRKAEND